SPLPPLAKSDGPAAPRELGKEPDADFRKPPESFTPPKVNELPFSPPLVDSNKAALEKKTSEPPPNPLLAVPEPALPKPGLPPTKDAQQLPDPGKTPDAAKTAHPSPAPTLPSPADPQPPKEVSPPAPKELNPPTAK